MQSTFYAAEIFLTKKHVTPEEWQELFLALADLQRPVSTWEVMVVVQNHQICYYIGTSYQLPTTVNDLKSFLFKSTVRPFVSSAGYASRPMLKSAGNLADLANYGQIKNYGRLERVEIKFRKLWAGNFYAVTDLGFRKKDKIDFYRTFATFPAQLLSVDFAANKGYIYKTPPKYTETNKILEFLHHDPHQAILSIDTFPYSAGEHFLKLQDYDFSKHSLVLGASGSGKSKFLGAFANNIYQNSELRAKYKIVMIDPHAAMTKDLGAIGRTIDFAAASSSIDLFAGGGEDAAAAAAELLLSLFKTLLADQYNSKLERVLRHAIYLLLTGEMMSFVNLRKLLLDLNFRNLTVKKLTPRLPFSVVSFFLSDFNELKTKSYAEAFSPIMSFLDEMEMVPAFNAAEVAGSLESAVRENFLTIFSLDRTKLGAKPTQVIAGLVMEQLLTLVERKRPAEQIIFIVDEVAVVENPILARLLSEARKYNLTLVLVGQFFNQFSTTLQNSILANVINYYIFRISRLEATLLADNLNLKIPADDTRERKVKLLAELDNRELVARVSMNGKLFPAFKARTVDFVASQVDGGRNE